MAIPSEYAESGQPDYGATDVLARKAPKKEKLMSNMVLAGVAILVPWLLFAIVFAALSFSMRYWYPCASWAIFFCALAATALSAARGFLEARKGRDASWLGMLSALMLVALVLGACLGDINFYLNIEPTHSALRMNTYENVDPTTQQGNQVMDAGQIVFRPDVGPDPTRAMGFRHHDMYCVAPIVRKDDALNPDGVYDFWAAGINCCSSVQKDFHCGELDNSKAHTGLRVVSEHHLPFFKLAVRQAEAAYNVQAPHPLLLTWLENPLDEVAAERETGMHFYATGLYCYLIGQCLVVGFLVILMTKLGPLLVSSMDS